MDQLAALAMIRGDVAERTLFARAAELARAHDIDSDSDLGPIIEQPPPASDPEVLLRLRHMYEAGAWVILESAIADLPMDLRWLFESGAVTIEQLASMHAAIGATSAADVADAIQTGALRAVEGFDESTITAVAAALPDLRAAIPRIPLGRAAAMAEPVLAQLRSLAGVKWALPAGSLRRGQETVGDIEFVVHCSHPADAIEQISRLPQVSRCLHRSARRLYVLLERVQLGLRFPEPENAGATLLQLTGSPKHVARLRSHAEQKGWRLTAAGLFTPGGENRPSPDEEDIYSALELPYIPPEIRHGDDEIERARRGELPELVSRRNIRGDLHMHSMWSDGRDSIEAMVVTCRALGYEYLAITDHSARSAASRNLTTQGVPHQAEEIARLRERYPDIAILHGCEVDIMPDGRLDFPDRILEQFDIVLASLHERAGQAPDQLFRRYMMAMKHPLVTIITHPTNRAVPNKPGYDLDYDRLFATAVETATVLEIDGAPVHLDLDGALARRAIAAGVTITVSSDSHRAEALGRQMAFGITTARRGWVEPRHVLNTRPLADVRTLIAAKRAL